jgi:hypothetical protein
MRTTSAFLLSLLLGLTNVSAQESSPAVVRDEIAQLFVTLSQSGCQFYRNGTWHDAEQAASHLKRKHDYLEKRNLVSSAESLIELAASKSSLSGKPYLVKCRGGEAVHSRVWFSKQLTRIRAGDGH